MIYNPQISINETQMHNNNFISISAAWGTHEQLFNSRQEMIDEIIAKLHEIKDTPECKTRLVERTDEYGNKRIYQFTDSQDS